LKVPYELKARREGSANRNGFDQHDVVYLVMPDRFANGDTTNDSRPEMLEKANRGNPDGRHGGDLKGIENHLDYIADLGMTALWLNPFVENNTPSYSYHGYAITDFYKTDPRIGTNDGYVGLVKKAHDLHLKIIMDMVFNHCGNTHWFITDLPSPDWIHQFSSYTRSNFKAPVVMDPYGAEADKKIMLDGWFDAHMPDLNQNNSHLAVYLTQNSIWWVEYADLDGIRMDTYMYPDPEFMALWRKLLRNEYPNLDVVGEVWIENKTLHAYWMKDAHNFDGYNSGLEYLTDFPMFDAIRTALNENTGWKTGAERIYYCLAQDIVYKHPEDNLTFLTNHDVSQFYTLTGENFGKFKLGITLLLTLRGIPQFYQGIEILMTGDQGKGHGKMRKDFPGGWVTDTLNAFTPEGRTPLQQEAFDYVKTIANWRKSCPAVQTGKTTQFIPENDVYVYFRYNEKQTVMIVMNFADTERTVTTARFSEIIKDFSAGKEIITGKEISELNRLTIPARTSMIIELHK
ncbi:MAG: alpha-amlyase, partial [Bacteroidetes bacterium HGW-Bacteroidetes-22]